MSLSSGCPHLNSTLQFHSTTRQAMTGLLEPSVFTKKLGGCSSITQGLFCARTLGTHWPALALSDRLLSAVRAPEGLVEAVAPRLSLER